MNNAHPPNAPGSGACGIHDKADGCLVTMEQVNQLPLYYRKTVHPDYLDAMGHMNIRWYMALFDDSTWPFFEAAGLTEDYFKRCNAGAFTLRQFIQYWSEVQAGHQVAVRIRFLGRSDKRYHIMHFMINESTNQVAAALESLGTHADLTRRRSSPLPEAIAERFDIFLEQSRRLDWEAPVCGAITL
jgi:acyl-CoA thioester hydrolase